MAIETYHPIPEKNWPAVEEVVQFVVDGQILSKPYQSDYFHDFPCDVAYEIADWTPYRVTGLPNSRCEVEWQDFLVSSEDEDSRLRKLSAKAYPIILSSEFNDKLNEIGLSLRNTIENQFAGVLPKDDICEIGLHFTLLIQVRAMMGSNRDCLIEEKLFNAYKAYGYPCGWSGPFPGGRLLVYSKK